METVLANGTQQLLRTPGTHQVPNKDGAFILPLAKEQNLENLCFPRLDKYSSENAREERDGSSFRPVGVSLMMDLCYA